MRRCGLDRRQLGTNAHGQPLWGVQAQHPSFTLLEAHQVVECFMLSTHSLGHQLSPQEVQGYHRILERGAFDLSELEPAVIIYRLLRA